MNFWLGVKQWYLRLTARERQYVGFAGVVAGALIVYFAIIAPLLGAGHHMSAAVEREAALYRWVNRASARIRALPAQATSSGQEGGGRGGSLLSIVDSTTSRNSLSGAIQQLEQTGPHAVQLTMQNVPFDSLIRWLGNLIQMRGVQVQQAVIERATEPGTVNATLTLKEAQTPT